MNEHKEEKSNKSEKGTCCYSFSSGEKWRKNTFFAVIGIIVFTIVMFYLRPDWRMIVLGTLAFLFGSALLVWSDNWGKSKFLKWKKGVVVPIILAIGGLLTTQGWNLRTNYFNDRARFVAMAAELKLNGICIELLSLAYGEYVTTGNREKMTALPLPRTHHVNQVLGFSDIQRNDSKLADMIFEYVFAADLLNPELTKIDAVSSSYIISNEAVKKIVQSVFDQERIFKAFRNIHKQLSGHIAANYGWCYEKASIKIRKPMVDAFYSAIASRYVQLNDLDHQMQMKRLRDLMEQQGIPIPVPKEDSNN
jgi:hypothetical protein